jgi:hypothetical protein
VILITAGGMMAWVDLGLRLVDRVLGPAVVQVVERYFLIDPGAREQRFYRTFAPTLTHGDAAILRVQHWLQGRSHDELTIAVMAAKARLGERTFLRRFPQATGHNPTEYVQHLRVAKARRSNSTERRPTCVILDPRTLGPCSMHPSEGPSSSGEQPQGSITGESVKLRRAHPCTRRDRGRSS